MRAVDATIRVDVEGEGGGTFYLNIRAGRMSAEARAAQAPFLTLIQDRRAFDRLSREAGDSALALLGGLSGIAGELVLTRGRVENLRSLNGLVRFEVTGDDGFALGTHFGAAPVPAEPKTWITVDAQTYRDLQSGALDPQSAFMNEQIRVEGDMRVAMQLALAAVASGLTGFWGISPQCTSCPQPRRSRAAGEDLLQSIAANADRSREGVGRSVLRGGAGGTDPVSTVRGQRARPRWERCSCFGAVLRALEPAGITAGSRCAARGCTDWSASRSARRSRGRARAARSPTSGRPIAMRAGLDGANACCRPVRRGLVRDLDVLRAARDAVSSRGSRNRSTSSTA